MSWYLRKSDKSIYGPVEHATLCAWAASGRIVPDDEVSEDQQHWQPAPSLSALKMDWVLDLGGGETFGPLHALALAELVRDGSVGPDQPVRHRADDIRCTLAEAVLPSLLQQPATPAVKPEGEIARLQEALSAAEQRLSELAQPRAAIDDPEVPRLRDELAAARQRIAELEQPKPLAEDPEVPRLQEALAQAQARITELEKPAIPVEDPAVPRLRDELAAARQRIAELEQPRPPAEDPELSRLRDALANAESRVKELEAKPAESPARLTEDNLISSALMQSYHKLSRNYDRLLVQMNEKSQELAQAIEAHARTTQELEARLTSTQESASADRRALDEARVRMMELEKTHLELVRSYRAMNDRYIRLRQQQSESGAAAPPPTAETKPKVRLV